MGKLNNVKFILPFLILFLLFAVLLHELFYSKPNELPSALIGESIPNFALPNLLDPIKLFTNDDLPKRVVLINVWSTWCYACTLEAPMLLKISREYRIPIFSIDYKDDPVAARDWIKKNGNPFIMTGIDAKGDTAIDLGVYVTPETFVVSPQGKIVYRHLGAIDQKTWDTVLYPLIKRYK